jgi:hypothetical protein
LWIHKELFAWLPWISPSRKAAPPLSLRLMGKAQREELPVVCEKEQLPIIGEDIYANIHS